MKRSEINAAMKNALKLFKEYKISLPPFVLWTPEEWGEKGNEVDEIRENMALMVSVSSRPARSKRKPSMWYSSAQ